jgi:hypothetical protein
MTKGWYTGREPDIDSEDEKERKIAFLIMAMQSGLLSDEAMQRIATAAKRRMEIITRNN